MRNVKVLPMLAGCLLFTHVNTVSASTTILPSNVELILDSQGLISISENGALFFKEDMLPGDIVEQTMMIKNNYDSSYELFLRAERVSEKEEFDLLTELELKVYNGDELIYDGPACGSNGMESNISLGTYEPGDETQLYAVVELDGPSTGNEYKNKSAQVNWIFTAVGSDESQGNPVQPEPPSTPQKPDTSGPITGYVMSGIGLLVAIGCIAVGIMTYMKRGKEE